MHMHTSDESGVSNEAIVLQWPVRKLWKSDGLVHCSV